MTPNEEQLERFREAVERKKEESDAAARAGQDPTGTVPPGEDGPETQRSLTEKGRTQDAYSVRDKNSQKGKKTADKWNQ